MRGILIQPVQKVNMRWKFAKGQAQRGDNSKLRVESIRLVQAPKRRGDLVESRVVEMRGQIDAAEDVEMDVRK